MTQPGLARGGCAGALALLAGCGEIAFSAHARDNDAGDLARALAASQAPEPGPQAVPGRPLVFLVGPAPEGRLSAFDLQSGRILWSQPAGVRSRLAVGRGLIAYLGGGDMQLAGRDPLSGQLKLSSRLRADERLVGIAVDQARLYYVVAPASGSGAFSLVGVDASGRELWRRSAPAALGAPAARGGLVAVPFSHQNLSLIDGALGVELARIRARGDEIVFARAQPDGFYYGSRRGWCRLDSASATGPDGKGGKNDKDASCRELRLRVGELTPFLEADGYQPAHSDYGAFDRNRLLWRGAAPGAEPATAYLHLYRYLFGFDARSGELRWAYSHPHVDLVAAQEVGAAVVFVSATGDIGALEARTGAAGRSRSTGLQVVGAAIDADVLGLDKLGLESAGTEPGSGAELSRSLGEILRDPDARFPALKRFALAALGRVPGKAAAAELLALLLSDAPAAEALQQQAGELLTERSDPSAAGLYLDALKVHYDFLEGRSPHALGVLCRVVVKLALSQAAPELSTHLADPATPLDTLPDVVDALAVAAGAQAAGPLREFLLTYRADPLFRDSLSPLFHAADALVRVGGQEGLRIVSFAAEDGRTLPALQRRLQALLVDPSPTSR